MIARYVAKFIFWLIGWKFDPRIPTEKKYIIIIAPHTSNWDFLIGKLTNWICGVSPKVLVKKEAFTFLTGPFIRMWGGIPIDRNNTVNIVDQVVQYFNDNEEFILGITPEGTRKRNPNWKTGFYRIAVKAKVPIFYGYIDFKTKTAGMHDHFDPTGDMEADMKKIKAYFKDMEGYHKEDFAIE
ncbi:MAG: lysophospholipid acyltransferase family protein [Bacteroidales bacterium]|nr:lysophospholipid acyltransferase family protein [Bacteroidales bacterium]